jgi:hypothetical protein
MPNCQQFTNGVTAACFVAANFLVARTTAGCGHQVSPKVSLAAASATSTTTASFSSLQQIQLLQNSPFFQAASAYCRSHQFSKALGELKQLALSQAASRGLTAVQATWLAGQRRRAYR